MKKVFLGSLLVIFSISFAQASSCKLTVKEKTDAMIDIWPFNDAKNSESTVRDIYQCLDLAKEKLNETRTASPLNLESGKREEVHIYIKKVKATYQGENGEELEITLKKK